MSPTEGRVAKPERRWGCRHGTPGEIDIGQVYRMRVPEKYTIKKASQCGQIVWTDRVTKFKLSSTLLSLRKMILVPQLARRNNFSVCSCICTLQRWQGWLSDSKRHRVLPRRQFPTSHGKTAAWSAWASNVTGTTHNMVENCWVGNICLFQLPTPLLLPLPPSPTLAYNCVYDC